MLEPELELVSLEEPDDMPVVEDDVSELLGVDDAEPDVVPVPLAPMLDVPVVFELEEL